MGLQLHHSHCLALAGDARQMQHCSKRGRLLLGLTVQVNLAAGTPRFSLAHLLYQPDPSIQGITCNASMHWGPGTALPHATLELSCMTTMHGPVERHHLAWAALVQASRRAGRMRQVLGRVS
jgi:hypothetical protein